MFIPFLLLAIVGIGLFSFSLIIHPNIVDAAMSGSLFFSIIGGIFILTGVIGLFVFYIKKYKEWKFDKNGVSIYGYVADVDPLIKNSNGKLCGYNVEFYVYEQDDTVSKEYQQYKLPFEIQEKNFVVIKKYNNKYKILKEVDESVISKSIKDKIFNYMMQK